MKRFVPFIAAGLMLLIVAVWYLALYSPKSADLSKAHDDLTAAQGNQQTLKAQLSNLRGLEANRAKQQASLQKLSAAVPPTPDLATFILQANDIATQAGVSWLQVSPGLPSGGNGGPTQIALSMQIEGTFYQVYDYLNRLENMQRLVLVDSVSISSKGSAAGSPDPLLGVAVSGRMFTRATPQTGGAGATGGTGGGTTTPTTASGSSPTTSNTKLG
jgi:type II secretory pathway component PulM